MGSVQAWVTLNKRPALHLWVEGGGEKGTQLAGAAKVGPVWNTGGGGHLSMRGGAFGISKRRSLIAVTMHVRITHGDARL